ncbi:MAG: Lrp/AsnC ligand binding domain-containing protein [Nitrososphaerota archaeon]|nr:Lrp/AsnC ligand binding domain-containing protein [Candidatus Bathyarchaeota archaeon]MDW8193927.1 Lrp/AsnC ligand binding domain-containing protein [Nitrososphaerota archaeon]
MIFAYILGKVERGSELDVLNALKNFEQVEKASIIYGAYDLCIEANFKTMEELNEFVFNAVRKTPGIKDTCTLIVAKIFHKKSQKRDVHGVA